MYYSIFSYNYNKKEFTLEQVLQMNNFRLVHSIDNKMTDIQHLYSFFLNKCE